MERTFNALTEKIDNPAVDVSVTPDTISDIDLNAIVSRIDDLAARLTKIEQAEKNEPWHGSGDGSGYSVEEINEIENENEKGE